MRKHLSLYLLILAFGLLHPAFTRAGESTIKAGLGFGGEYNDNVGETSDNRKTDFITHIKPAFKFHHEGGRVVFSADYRGDYQFYNRGKAQDDYMHYLNLSLTGEVVENLFFIDVSEDLQPVYIDAARGDVVEGDTATDLVNRNTFTFSPYFRLHFSDRTDTRFGYRFTDLRYSAGSDRTEPIPGMDGEYDFSSKVSLQHSLFAEVNHALTDRVNLTAGLDATRYDVEKSDTTDMDPSLTRYQAYVGGAWEAAEDFTLRLVIGPSYSVPDEGDAKLQPYMVSSAVWKVGRSEFGLSYEIDYFDDPETGGSNQRTTYSGWWNKAFDRSALTVRLAYNSYDRTEGGKEKYIRPSFSYSYDLTERLKATASLTADISQNDSENASLYYMNAGLRYELDENSWVGITYRRKTVDDSGDEGRYDINRVMIEAYFAF